MRARLEMNLDSISKHISWTTGIGLSPILYSFNEIIEMGLLLGNVVSK